MITGLHHIQLTAPPNSQDLARKSHPAFSVAGLAALREQLEKAGYTTEDNELWIGYNRFYVRDPFGNRLEFIESLSVTG